MMALSTMTSFQIFVQHEACIRVVTAAHASKEADKRGGVVREKIHNACVGAFVRSRALRHGGS